MKVSVVVPVYNGELFIEEALDSVLSQTYRDIEIIVVNDGSTDNTGRILEKFAPHIIRIDQENRGLVAARARGIAEATSPWIAFLDADDIWLPTKLEKQVEVAHGHTKYGIVTTDFLSFRGEHVECASVKEWYSPRSGNVFESLIFGNWITPSAAMVKRECFDLVRTFEIGRQSFGEDWLMWMQITPHYPVYFIDEVLMKRRIHGQNMSRTDDEGQFTAILRNFETLQRLVPELNEKKDLVNAALFRICMNRGRRNLSAGDSKLAAAKFKRAVKCQPWSPAAWAYRTVSALPDVLLKFAVSAQRKI